MIKRGFFLQYHEYKMGLRFVIGENGKNDITLYNNQEKQQGDESFGTVLDYVALQKRLLELYPEIYMGRITLGEMLFAQLVMKLAHVVARSNKRYL